MECAAEFALGSCDGARKRLEEIIDGEMKDFKSLAHDMKEKARPHRSEWVDGGQNVDKGQIHYIIFHCAARTDQGAHGGIA
jgi:hypothetical protein